MKTIEKQGAVHGLVQPSFLPYKGKAAIMANRAGLEGTPAAMMSYPGYQDRLLPTFSDNYPNI